MFFLYYFVIWTFVKLQGRNKEPPSLALFIVFFSFGFFCFVFCAEASPSLPLALVRHASYLKAVSSEARLPSSPLHFIWNNCRRAQLSAVSSEQFEGEILPNNWLTLELFANSTNEKWELTNSFEVKSESAINLRWNLVMVSNIRDSKRKSFLYFYEWPPCRMPLIHKRFFVPLESYVQLAGNVYNE